MLLVGEVVARPDFDRFFSFSRSRRTNCRIWRRVWRCLAAFGGVQNGDTLYNIGILQPTRGHQFSPKMNKSNTKLIRKLSSTRLNTFPDEYTSKTSYCCPSDCPSPVSRCCFEPNAPLLKRQVPNWSFLDNTSFQ